MNTLTFLEQEAKEVAVQLTYCDGYKLGHPQQYPDKTEYVQSNFTPRTTRIPGQEFVIAFGFQRFLDRYMNFDNFFAADIDKVADRYTRRVNGYLGPNTIGQDNVRALHDLGYVPIRFSGVPEGTHVPLNVPMLLIENTHPDFGWLVNFFETLLSCEIWLPCTSATRAYRFREILERYAVKTGSPVEFIDWQGHDFSMRGMAGLDAAKLSGMGHLLFFTGTDTIPAIDDVEDYYGEGLADDYLIGGSVPATEHSVMCAGGELSELETFRRLFNIYPTGIVSVVSDTWDYFNVLTNILHELHDEVMERDGKLVVRPDSGDPVKIVVGDPDAPVGSPEYRGTIEILWDEFGGTLTETGHKMLDSHIGCIYGDSITEERAEAILEGLEAKGFASANMVFGVGSFTYQYVTRDTFGFAMKATWAQIDGVGHDLFKDPKTDDGSKKSAKGRLAVLDVEGTLTLVNQASAEQEAESVLTTIWEDGKFVRRDNFETIRSRARA